MCVCVKKEKEKEKAKNDNKKWWRKDKKPATTTATVNSKSSFRAIGEPMKFSFHCENCV